MRRAVMSAAFAYTWPECVTRRKGEVRIDDLYRLAKGLNRRFPNGNEPYQIMTRLLEECGELASEVNHHEGSGIKAVKHGAPDRQRLADELKNVLAAVAQVALYYGVREALDASIKASIDRLRGEGHLP